MNFLKIINVNVIENAKPIMIAYFKCGFSISIGFSPNDNIDAFIESYTSS
jgi:hypothetical protein